MEFTTYLSIVLVPWQGHQHFALQILISDSCVTSTLCKYRSIDAKMWHLSFINKLICVELSCHGMRVIDESLDPGVGTL